MNGDDGRNTALGVLDSILLAGGLRGRRFGPSASTVVVMLAAILSSFTVTAPGGVSLLLGQASNGTVVGHVSDQQGAPLVTACVAVEGSDRLRGCVDRHGSYFLKDVPAGEVTLVIEAPGFVKARRTVEVPSPGVAILEVSLRRATLDLDGITATAERTVERGASVGVVERRHLQSPDEIARLLRDALAGLRAASRGGQVGAGSDVRIRGTVSVTQGNSPLVYLDGIRLGTAAVPGPEGGSQAISMLSLIDPWEVERIEVLRGAAATTLYGMEASAGVILIETRRDRQPR